MTSKHIVRNEGYRTKREKREHQLMKIKQELMKALARPRKVKDE